MKKCNILVVEDEALIAANLVHTLSSLGFTVPKPVATGEEAIRAVKARQPDLVLMDIQLIGAMNGIDAAEKIRAIADIPIVYLTAHTDDLHLKQAQLTEPYGYIAKPAHSRELHATIEMAMYKHGLDRKLKESEQKYRDIFKNSVTGLFKTTPDGSLIDVNDTFARLYGHSGAAEMLADSKAGKQLYISRHLYANPEERTEIHQILAEKGKIENYETRHIKRDGTHLWVSITARIIRDAEGTVLFYEGTVIDITKRKVAEEALKKSQIQLAEAMDLAHLVNWEFDVATGIFTFDDRFYALYGTISDIEGGNQMSADMYAKKFVHPDDQYLVADEVNKAIQTTDPVYMSQLEHRIIRRNGEIRHIVVRIGILKDKNGRTIKTHGANQDITERKRAEEALQRQSRLQQLLMEISSTYINLPLGTVEKAIQVSLGDLAGFVGADRAYIFEYDFNRQLCNNTHEWCTEGIEPQINNLQEVPLANMPEWVELNCKGKPVYVPDVLSLPAGNLRDMLEPQGIKSLLAIPMMSENDCFGFLGFDSVQKHYDYSENEQYLLTFFAQMLVNVRHRKRAEEALQESETQLLATLESTADGILAVDNKGKVLQVSRRFVEIWKIPPSVMERSDDRVLLDFVLDQLNDPNAFLKKVQLLYDSDAVDTDTLTFKDGRVFERYSSPMIMDGARIGRVWSFRDITERKKAEKALQESEDFNRNLVENLPDYIVVYGPDGKILYVNPASAKGLGYDAEKLVGTPILSYVVENQRDEVISRISERRKGGEVSPYEIELLTRDGHRRSVIVKGTSIKYQNNPAFLILFVDITERKVAEENLVAEFKRTQEQQAALNTISLSPHLFSGDVHGLSARLTELSSAVLGVERASVWLFNSKGDELRCIDLYEVLYDRHSFDHVLKRYEYVNEFDALRTAKYIDAHDPLTDPRTAGYVKSYLKPNHITSMLDAVIRLSGQNLGLLCFEHVDCPHHWESDEIAFACQLADQIAITLLNRDRKHAEEALKESEEKYRALFSAESDGIFVVDKDSGTIINCNDAVTKMYGYRKDEVIGQLNTVMSAEPDETRAATKEFKDSIPIRYHKRKDGTVFPVEITANVVSVQGRDVIVAAVRDITERKRAEEALWKSEQKYRNVVEDQTEFICRFLPDGTHIFVNDAYCRYFDKKREEIIGHRFRPVLHPEDREHVARHLASLTTEHPVMDIDQRVIMPDGSIRWQQWSDRAIFDPDGRVIEYQSVGRDITEQKELEKEMKYHEQELRKYSTSLAAANKKLTLLSGITRHDINNQMTVLMGYLTILQKKQTDPALNEYFVKVSNAAQRISAMIQFTSEYEKIGVNVPIWHDVRTVLDTAVKQAPLGKIMVKNDLTAGTEVFADPLVVKVCYNLMDNAVRYGGKITTIRFSVEEAGEDHLIVCEDDGDGVVAEEKEKIFERGFGKNTGLGLALSREILSITGITIRENGEPGKGARFEMVVPKGAWRMTGK